MGKAFIFNFDNFKNLSDLKVVVDEMDVLAGQESCLHLRGIKLHGELFNTKVVQNVTTSTGI